MRAPSVKAAILGGNSTLVPSFDLNFARLDNPVTKYGFTFTRATSATYVNASGLIATAASGELRYTYDPVTLSALGVLIEEQRTNLVIRSSEIDNGSWNISADVFAFGSGSVANSVATLDPAGTNTAELLTEKATTATHYASILVTTSASTAYTFSVFVKANNRGYATIQVNDGTSANAAWCAFNLTTGVVSQSPTMLLGTFTAMSASTQKYGNGWWRCIFTLTTNTVANCIMYVGMSDTGTQRSYAGDGTSGIFVWGAQCELGAFATSYIPTTGTAATRNADVLSLTGAAGRTNLIVGSAAPANQSVTVTATPYTLSQTGSGTITLSGASTAGPLVGAGSLTFTPSAGSLTLTMSGSPANVQLETGSSATTYIPTTSGPRTVENVANWFNGDAGTWVAQVTRSIAPSGQTGVTAPRVMTIYDAAATNSVYISLAASGSGRSLGAIPAGTQWDITPTAAYAEDGTAYRIAMAYAENDVQVCAKGVLGTADTSAVMPSGSQYIALSGIGNRYFNGTISRIRYYPRRLPNATLQSLTT